MRAQLSIESKIRRKIKISSCGGKKNKLKCSRRNNVQFVIVIIVAATPRTPTRFCGASRRFSHYGKLKTENRTQNTPTHTSEKKRLQHSELKIRTWAMPLIIINATRSAQVFCSYNTDRGLY